MTLLISWVLYPLALAALCLGCGLLVDACARGSVPGELLLPVGLAAIVVIAEAAIWHEQTAPASRPAVLIAAIAGLWLGRRRLLRRPPTWAPFAVAGGVFAVYAAPIVLSGEASWAGFIKLDDTATWWAFTDRLMDHGYDLAGLEPSTYRETLRSNLPGGYPAGAFLPLGASQFLVAQDVAWVFQPYMSVLAALLGLVLYALLEPLGLRPALRAVAASVAAQAATLFGYVMWGGIKEITAALLLALAAASMGQLWTMPVAARRGLPLAVVAAALLATYGLAAGVWLLPMAVIAAGVALMRGARAAQLVPTLGQLVLVAAAAAVLLVPAYSLTSALRLLGGGLAADAADEDIGNLFGPLSVLQVLGVWPSDDFRNDPSHELVTHAILGVLVLAALAGIVVALRRRAWPLLAYAGLTAIGSALALRLGGTWVDAKTLALTSPLPLVLAMGGALALVTGLRRPVTIAAVAAAVLVGGGVLWSNALAYRGVALAPHDRMAEIQTIGERFAGEGPTLFTDAVPHAGRHFLRRMDGEGASDLRWRAVLLRNGETPADQTDVDPDAIRLDQLLVYRALVVRRAPSRSRPPSSYRRVWQGRYYEVWLREPGPRILNHTPLGDESDAAGQAPCRAVLELAAAAARQGGTLVAATRPRSVVAPLTIEDAPIDWLIGAPGTVVARTAGTAVVRVEVPAPGRYAVWVSGSFGPGFDVTVDGRPAGSVGRHLQYRGQYLPVGALRLEAGRHAIALERKGAGLGPGSTAPDLFVGPVALEPARDDRLVRVAPGRARSLCGRSLDWIEVVER